MGDKYKLFNLDTDLGEKTDISAQHPEKLEELREMLLAHEQRVKSARRPAGHDTNPVPILEDPGSLPSRAEYMKKADLQAVGKLPAKKTTGKKKKVVKG